MKAATLGQVPSATYSAYKGSAAMEPRNLPPRRNSPPPTPAPWVTASPEKKRNALANETSGPRPKLADLIKLQPSAEPQSPERSLKREKESPRYSDSHSSSDSGAESHHESDSVLLPQSDETKRRSPTPDRKQAFESDSPQAPTSSDEVKDAGSPKQHRRARPRLERTERKAQSLKDTVVTSPRSPRTPRTKPMQMVRGRAGQLPVFKQKKEVKEAKERMFSDLEVEYEKLFPNAFAQNSYNAKKYAWLREKFHQMCLSKKSETEQIADPEKMALEFKEFCVEAEIQALAPNMPPLSADQLHSLILGTQTSWDKYVAKAKKATGYTTKAHMLFRLSLIKPLAGIAPISNDDMLHGVVPIFKSHVASFDFTTTAVGVGLFRGLGEGDVFGLVFDSHMEDSLAPLIKMVFDHFKATKKKGLGITGAELRQNNKFLKGFAPLADKMLEFMLGLKFPDVVRAVFNPLLVSLDDAATEFLKDNSLRLSALGITADEIQKLKNQIGADIKINDTDDDATKLVKRDLEIRASHEAAKIGVVRALFLRLVQPQITVAAEKRGKLDATVNAFCSLAANSVFGVINGYLKEGLWNSPEVLEVMHRRLPEMSAHFAAIAEKSSI